MVQNPYVLINDRFDKIESLICNLKSEIKRPNVGNPSERLTRKEIQKEYKISLSTIHKLMKTGKLSYFKVGRKTLFKRSDVESYFNKKGGAYHE